MTHIFGKHHCGDELDKENMGYWEYTGTTQLWSAECHILWGWYSGADLPSVWVPISHEKDWWE